MGLWHKDHNKSQSAVMDLFWLGSIILVGGFVFGYYYRQSMGPGMSTNRADMEGVTLVIADGVANLVGPGCSGTISTVEFDEGRDGAFALTAPGDIDTSAACEVVGIASAGLAESSGFMIDENRLTLIGKAGETVGFIARG